MADVLLVAITNNFYNAFVNSHIFLMITHYRPAMPFGNRKKNTLADLFG